MFIVVVVFARDQFCDVFVAVDSEGLKKSSYAEDFQIKRSRTTVFR